MIREYKTYDDLAYPEDVRRIVMTLASVGYFVRPEEADQLWDEHSNSQCASWLYLPTSDEQLKSTLVNLIEGREDA